MFSHLSVTSSLNDFVSMRAFPGGSLSNIMHSNTPSIEVDNHFVSQTISNLNNIGSSVIEIHTSSVLLSINRCKESIIDYLLKFPSHRALFFSNVS